MKAEWTPEELAQMSSEERARFDQEVFKRVARFKELKPSAMSWAETKLPKHQRLQYRYQGSGAAVGEHLDAPAIPAGDYFSISTVYSEPGKGAARHAHTTQEFFMALSGKWEITWGEQGQHSIILEQYDAVSVPGPCMRSFRNAGDEPGYLLAIVGSGNPPAPVYHPSVDEEIAAFEAGSKG
jgi:mannose-6-phosphate isomerase-like protein (cupin superfamily)